MKSCIERLTKVTVKRASIEEIEDDVDRRPQADVDLLICSAEESKVGVNKEACKRSCSSDDLDDLMQHHTATYTYDSVRIVTQQQLLGGMSFHTWILNK